MALMLGISGWADAEFSRARQGPYASPYAEGVVEGTGRDGVVGGAGDVDFVVGFGDTLGAGAFVVLTGAGDGGFCWVGRGAPCTGAVPLTGTWAPEPGADENDAAAPFRPADRDRPRCD